MQIPTTAAEIRGLQQKLLEHGFYTGKVDGVWGPVSGAALRAYEDALTQQRAAVLPPNATASAAAARPLPWGACVGPEFRAKVRSIAAALGMPSEGAGWLMSCIAWESGESFSSAIKNGAGSGAVGLIQFMPATAKELGTNVQELATLTPEAQLEYVYRYFLPYKRRLNTLSDLYMAILWPAAIGKPEDHKLWSQDSRPTTYRQNIGLDVNKDFSITKAEAASKVQAKLIKGSLPQYARA